MNEHTDFWFTPSTKISRRSLSLYFETLQHCWFICAQPFIFIHWWPRVEKGEKVRQQSGTSQKLLITLIWVSGMGTRFKRNWIPNYLDYNPPVLICDDCAVYQISKDLRANKMSNLKTLHWTLVTWCSEDHMLNELHPNFLHIFQIN